MRQFRTSLCAASILCLPHAGAVIVGGISGTGNNNDSQAGLDSYLSTSSLTAFSYWDNLVRVADASGVYLGYNASTMRGWVLTANHVTPPTSITVAGQAYTVNSGTQIGGSDLKLYEIGGGGDPALPSLPTVPLANVTATPGETALMFGRGFTSSSSDPFPWGTPGTSDANVMRWASNTVEGTALVNIGTVQPYIYVDFDGAGDPGVTEFDGQASLGDSGGGLFILRGGEWQLAGNTHFVDDGPDFLELLATGDGATNPSEYGDFSAYSDVASKSATIAGITGTLVPEPSSLMFALVSAASLIRRRRH